MLVLDSPACVLHPVQSVFFCFLHRALTNFLFAKDPDKLVSTKARKERNFLLLTPDGIDISISALLIFLYTLLFTSNSTIWHFSKSESDSNKLDSSSSFSHYVRL